MSLYEQIWREEEYVPRQHVHIRDLPKNHLKKIKSVKFDFTDYKVYDKLACYPYERMVIQCANTYGAEFYFKNRQCRDVANFFKECVQLNHVMGKMKRTQPEFFADNQYSRDKPNFSELAI